MEGLILCQGKLADNPYYIAESDTYIYSVEELCYYIYNNIYFIENDFVNEKLADFIDNQLSEEYIAENLRNYLNKKSSANYNQNNQIEALAMIISSVDYYTKAQQQEFVEKLKILKNTSVARRMKMCGDNFLQKEKYESALNYYFNAISKAKNDKSEDDEFVADTYYNIGITYAKLMLYHRASRHFLKSYEIGKKEIAKRNYYFACYMMNEEYEEGDPQFVEMSQQAKEIVETIRREAQEGKTLKNVEVMINSGTDRKNQLLDNLKSECARYLK